METEFTVPTTNPVVRALLAAEMSADSGIRPEFARVLYRTVQEVAPVQALEIGLANAVSSLTILGALQGIGDTGRALTSIDPYQVTDWQSRGLGAIRQAGLDSHHTHIGTPDFFALPELLKAGKRYQFAYIDGWHTFDYTLLDFWYIDRMLDVDGVVAFNDCHLAAVTKVCRFVTTHRRYIELDVGLPPEYGSNPIQRVKRRVEGRNGADRYFRKVENWEPAWDFFRRF